MNQLEMQLNEFDVYLIQKMLDFRNYKRFYASELAKFLGIHRTHPSYYRIMKVLRSIGVVNELEIIGNVKMLSLDYKKLKELYWNQKPVQKSIDTFVHHYTALIAY